MTRKPSERPSLTVPREEARRDIQQQLDKGKELPNVSIHENKDARKWYDYTAQLLRQMCTTDELTDEFTGRSSLSFGTRDITVGSYLDKLRSMHERLDLYREEVSEPLPTAFSDSLLAVERVISRFHTVARQLRHRHNNRPTLEISDEYDVQDLLHALLRIHFDDVRQEEWTPSYAGASSRMDFLLKAERIVVEVKKPRSGLGAKEIGEELSVDIVKYRAHPDCEFLICFVYDPEERILNPRGIEEDLSEPMGGINVRVHIAQR